MNLILCAPTKEWLFQKTLATTFSCLRFPCNSKEASTSWCPAFRQSANADYLSWTSEKPLDSSGLRYSNTSDLWFLGSRLGLWNKTLKRKSSKRSTSTTSSQESRPSCSLYKSTIICRWTKACFHPLRCHVISAGRCTKAITATLRISKIQWLSRRCWPRWSMKETSKYAYYGIKTQLQTWNY